jgi:glucose-1-phosphate thymidylyltransferase
MKGIILSGGLGTRLYPCTRVLSKQLLPVYDKPLIYYPLSTLMLAGIRDILIITSASESEQESYKKLLGDGSRFGIKISYKVQPEPKGIAECFLIAENWIGKDNVALILGDNLYYGNDMISRVLLAKDSVESFGGCSLFAYHVADPERFGVLNVDEDGFPLGIVEKPKTHIGNWAITGLYFYDNRVVQYAKSISPSARGELEITDVNNLYIREGLCSVEYLNRGIAWIDTGTFESLAEASVFVGAVQKRTGMMIGCPEEIAYDQCWITREQLVDTANEYSKSDYGKYLFNILKR